MKTKLLILIQLMMFGCGAPMTEEEIAAYEAEASASLEADPATPATTEIKKYLAYSSYPETGGNKAGCADRVKNKKERLKTAAQKACCPTGATGANTKSYVATAPKVDGLANIECRETDAVVTCTGTQCGG